MAAARSWGERDRPKPSIDKIKQDHGLLRPVDLAKLCHAPARLAGDGADGKRLKAFLEKQKTKIFDIARRVYLSEDIGEENRKRLEEAWIASSSSAKAAAEGGSERVCVELARLMFPEVGGGGGEGGGGAEDRASRAADDLALFMRRKQIEVYWRDDPERHAELLVRLADPLTGIGARACRGILGFAYVLDSAKSADVTLLGFGPDGRSVQSMLLLGLPPAGRGWGRGAAEEDAAEAGAAAASVKVLCSAAPGDGAGDGDGAGAGAAVVRGAPLLFVAEKLAALMGARAVRLESVWGAFRFYEAAGYAFDPGRPEVLAEGYVPMEKNVVAAPPSGADPRLLWSRTRPQRLLSEPTPSRVAEKEMAARSSRSAATGFKWLANAAALMASDPEEEDDDDDDDELFVSPEEALGTAFGSGRMADVVSELDDDGARAFARLLGDAGTRTMPDLLERWLTEGLLGLAKRRRFSSHRQQGGGGGDRGGGSGGEDEGTAAARRLVRIVSELGLPQRRLVSTVVRAVRGSGKGAAAEDLADAALREAREQRRQLRGSASSARSSSRSRSRSSSSSSSTSRVR